MRWTLILLASLSLFTIPAWIIPSRSQRTPSPGIAAAITLFRTEAPLFSASCTALQEAIREYQPGNTASLTRAKERLAQCRLHYKKIESFLEYFFSNSAHVYNSPPKYEPEYPNMEYQDPVGLQLIETLLFDPHQETHRQELTDQAEVVASSSRDLIPLLYDFAADDRQLLESLRIGIIRIMSLGITGYDAPQLKTGIAESAASLRAISTQLQPYLKTGDRRSDSLRHALDLAIAFLEKTPGNAPDNAPDKAPHKTPDKSPYKAPHKAFDKSFNTSFNTSFDKPFNTSFDKAFDQFDRLGFLSRYAIPLQHQLGAFIREQDLLLNTNHVLNYEADNLFSRDAFDLNSFPMEGAIPSGENRLREWTPRNGKEQMAIRRLGLILFSETSLSGDGTRSCASCHDPGKAFTDGLSRPMSLDGHSRLDRNAPSLLYSALQHNQFWDGRVRSLEEQIRTVIHEPREMAGNDSAILLHLRKLPLFDSLLHTGPYTSYTTYKTSTTVAADPSLTAHAADPSLTSHAADASFTANASGMDLIVASLAAYVRSLAPMNSPFDRYMQGDARAMDISQRRGANLFLGKAQCATCHFIPLFNGLIPPDYLLTEFESLGTTSTDDLLHPTLDADQGRGKPYPLPFNKAAFKTPTVRNSARSAPYMHNGAFRTLDQVLDFYNRGGGAGLGLALPEQTLSPTPLHLNPAELKDLLHFMQALNDSLPDAKN